jgi:hypothetical protein
MKDLHSDLDAGLDVKVLDRVRALLAKAESTAFAEEAEAFTAKAHQLMDRHAIDRAMLADAPGSARRAAEGRRISVDQPYASAKASLLGAVARATRCQAVWVKEAGFVEVFGYPDDLDTVELLHTSLLLQATSSMLAAGSAGARYRQRAFRHAFIVAFAARIGRRLQEAAAATVATAREDHGSALVPVLARRSDEVAAVRDEAYPHVHRRRASASDAAGWTAGTIAADGASLHHGAPLRPGSRTARGA